MKKVSLLVYKIVSQIPIGKVVTYGYVAKKLKIKSARSVGRILHNNPKPEKYPCHRVVFADGNLSSSYAFGGKKSQMEKLKKEGVEFVNDKVKSDYILFPPKIKSV